MPISHISHCIFVSAYEYSQRVSTLLLDLIQNILLKEAVSPELLKIRKHSYTPTLRGLYIKWTLFVCRFVTSFYAIPIWHNVIFALCVTALINLVHMPVK